MKRLLFLLLVLLFIGCEKVEKTNLPYASVYFRVDLQFQDKELSGSLSTKTFEKARLANERVGVGGILVINGIGDYYAYELCCPHEAQRNVKVEPTDAGTAVCPQCNTVYDIAYGSGAPTSGQSKHQLRRFNVHHSGSELIITY